MGDHFELQGPKTVLPDSLAPVIEGGYCVGCGVCAAVKESPIRIVMDKERRYIATASSASKDSIVDDSLGMVCPFSNSSVNEHVLGEELFSKGSSYNPLLGYYLGTYAGHAAEGDFRASGSSGGMVSWMVNELFDKSMIDGAIHVHPASGDVGQSILKYRISRSAEEARSRSKSSYYPVELSEVLSEIRRVPGRYALVGIPCFIKAVRLLARQDPVIADRIAFTIGLVCGHLKSARYADFIAWQAGIQPGKLRGIDFRRKVQGMNSNDYGIGLVAEGESGEDYEAFLLNRNIFGASWGYGFFMYQACDFCDDVLAETADITMGDAWLKEYVSNSQGANIVVVRNPALADLIEQGRSQGRLVLNNISENDVIESQAGCFRQRKDGLAYRLFLKDRAQEWRPRKRVEPAEQHLSPRLRAKYALRAKLMNESHRIFVEHANSQDFASIKLSLLPLMSTYDKVDRPAWRRFLSWGKRTVRNLIGTGV